MNTVPRTTRAAKRPLPARAAGHACRRAPPASPTTHDRAATVGERVAFFRAMAAIAAKKIARGQPWAALALLSLVARTLDGVRTTIAGDDGQADYEDRRATAPPMTPAEQLAALRALAREMESLTPQVLALGADVPADVAPQVHRFFDLAEAMLRETAPGDESGH